MTTPKLRVRIAAVTMCFLISCVTVIGQQQQAEPQLDKPETDKRNDDMLIGETEAAVNSVAVAVSDSVSNSASDTNSGSNTDSELASRYGNRLLLPLTTASPDISSRKEQLPNYEAPDDCYYQSDVINIQAEVMLTCNLRSINSELDTTNFSVIPRQLTVGLRLICNDEVLVKSSLQPQSFAHLQHLQILIIEYCKLASLNRHALEGLSQLRNLTIRSYNTMWPTVNFDIEANAFADLKNLEYLDLSSNNVWVLPETIFCPLTALTVLNMSGNCLQDISELGFRERPKEALNDSLKLDNNTAGPENCNLDLDVLDVSFNHFVLLPSNGFSTLKRMRVLMTNNNEISMLADSALNGLKNLQIINFSSNRIVALPSELFSDQAHSIQQIYLQNNTISVLSPKLFSNLDQLQTLDLSHNQITSTWIDSKTFAGLIRLVLLNLSHNKLTSLEPQIFTDLYTLQILNLRNNQIENILPDTFAPMNNLHTLLLSHNKLKYLEGNALNGLYVLSLLSLDNNQLIGIHPEALRNCSSLENLNLNGNQLKSVPVALRNMRLLRTLDLGENMISLLEANAFKGLANLYGLRLIGNHLENITLYAFQELISLQILNLARNRIAVVKAGCFDIVPNIQAIRLDGNQLADINGLFSNMPSLLWLNISDNQLEYFDYALIPSTLQWLDLHQNRLVGLSNRFGLDQQIRLQTLDASFNRMPRISPASIPNSIELLFLNDNLINTIDPDTFYHKINLTRVDLYDNQINTLSVKSLRILPYDDKRLIPQFYIGGNPFVCDCNIDWLQKINYMKSQQYPRIMDLETIYCKLLNHRERAYIPLIEAEPKHFLCTYSTHCFAVCHCCEFDACDCEMICPANCTCYHDQTWSTNIVECSAAGYSRMPRKVPMDTTELYIDGNQFIQLPGHSFLGRKNLAVLYINNSNIEYIYNTTFSGLKRLVVLHLEDNGIEDIWGSEFIDLENLRELYLHNNRIARIANGSFQTLRKLEVLRLDGNRLVYFEIWQLAMNPFLVEIGLAGNQWSCDCNYLMHFRIYLGQSNGKVLDAASISCVYNNATNVLHEKNGTRCTLHEDMATYVQANEMDNLLPVLLIAICTFVGVFGLICGLFYYRRELKLWLQANCLLCSNSSGFIEDLDSDRLNDAYFAYSFQDEHFVNQILAHTLERDMAYRLCLHYRDININAYTSDIILEAADTAKQIVLVLSKNFLYNEWSRFEYKSALHELIKRRKRTVFILYGDLPQRDIDVDMRHYLRSSTCLEWDDKKFWQKLRIALPHIRSKSAAGPYVNQRSTLNIYAASHEYQSSTNGPLAANTPRLLINEKLCSDCSNYSTINDCTRSYAILPATATATAPACKFNTVNELAYKASKNCADQQHSRTLDLQRHHQQMYQQIHQPVCVNSIHLQNYQVQHEYAVPSFYCASTAPSDSKEETAAPTYDSVVYNKEASLQNSSQQAFEGGSLIRSKRTISSKKSPQNYILNRSPAVSPIPALPSTLSDYSQITKTSEKMANLLSKTKMKAKGASTTATSTSMCCMVSSTMPKKTNYNCTQTAGRNCRCSMLLRSNSRQTALNLRTNNNNNNNNNSNSNSNSNKAINGDGSNCTSSRSNSNSSSSSSSSSSNSTSSCHTSHDSCSPDEDNNLYASHVSLKAVSVSEQNLSSLWA